MLYDVIGYFINWYFSLPEWLLILIGAVGIVTWGVLIFLALRDYHNETTK